MTSKLHRLVCLIGIALVYAIGCFPQSASAIESSNVIMGMDGLVAFHSGDGINPNTGLFRGGVNTFQSGAGTVIEGGTTQGRYKSFHFLEIDSSTGGQLNHNGRVFSDSPVTFGTSDYIDVVNVPLNANHIAILDRAAFGAMFDPADYEIEVKFKPNLNGAFLVDNEAALFVIVLEQSDGFMMDETEGILERANEQFNYNVGSLEAPINAWYASAPKDADGFATWTVPLTSPNVQQRGFYHNRGDNLFRADDVVGGGGCAGPNCSNTTAALDEVLDGPDFDSFGDPATTLNVPNGLNILGVGSSFAEDARGPNLSVEIKSVAVKKINSGSLVARLDAFSGITDRIGTPLAYDAANPAPASRPQDSAIVVNGASYSPVATDQISRFDGNGMTNLVLNPREPLNGEGYQFFLRGAPSVQTFDGTEATVNVRARLTEPLTNAGVAQTLTLMAKDLDGNDMAANEGADDFRFNLALNQFNTSTFTTVSIPLTDFTRIVDDTSTPIPAFGFANLGDNSMAEFNLYEFGGIVGAGNGLLRLEIEYMEIRLPEVGLAGDFNSDGVVDAADYVVWRKNDAANNPLPNDTGLATQVARYNLWRSNFGNMAGGGGVAIAAPEPAAWLLTTIAAGVLGLARRRVG